MTPVHNTKGIFSGSVLLFAVVMALYATAVPRELLWDDGIFLEHNAFVRDCSNLGTVLNPVNLFKVLPVSMSARPVVNAALIIDACLGGGAPGMHLTNAIIHAFNAILVFLLIFTVSGAASPALFGALVFAVHPAAAETVNIITFRSHLLGFFFFMSGLLAAIFHARKSSPGLAATTAACYLLAMLSVETSIVLPIAAMAAIYFEKGQKGLKSALPLMAVLAALAVFYLWFRTPRSGYLIPGVSHMGVSGPSLLYPKFLFPAATHAATRTFTVIPWRLIYENPLARLYTMARIVLDYFTALVLPFGLNSDYNPAVITSAAAGLWPLAAGAAVAAAAIALFTRKRLEGLGLALLLTALLPALNIWPAYNIKADRYLYLPGIGFSLAAAAVFARIPRLAGARRLCLVGAAWLWLGTLVFLTVARIPEFTDNFAFFSAAVKKNPALPKARLNLAGAYLRFGNYSAAIGQTLEAARLDPQNHQMRQSLIFTLVYCGRRLEALKRPLPSLPEADALYLSGLLRLKSDKRAAIDFLQRALKTNPGNQEARLTLILAENRTTAGLAPSDRENLENLKEIYRHISLH